MGRPLRDCAAYKLDYSARNLLLVASRDKRAVCPAKRKHCFRGDPRPNDYFDANSVAVIVSRGRIAVFVSYWRVVIIARQKRYKVLSCNELFNHLFFIRLTNYGLNILVDD